MTLFPHKFLPRSLSGRVFAMFGLCMLVFLLFGLGMFYRYQFSQRLADTDQAANTIADITAQAIAHESLEGDATRVEQVMHLALAGSPLKSAAFRGPHGMTVLAAPPAKGPGAPAWLVHAIDRRMPDVVRKVEAGGQSIGVLGLAIDAAAIAAQLWDVAVQTAALVAAFALACYLLMRSTLRRWLANLQRLQHFENEVSAGEVTAEAPLLDDAPVEIQDAIHAINRTTASLRNQYGERIAHLMHTLLEHKRAMDQVASMCEVDKLGRIVDANEQFVRCCGIAREALAGMELATIGRPANASGLPWVPSPLVWTGEVTVSGAQGETQWFRTVVPILGADKAVEKYICIDIDITARKDFEQAILDNARRQTLIAALGQKALHASMLDELFAQAAATAAQGLNTRFAVLLEADTERNVAIARAVAGWPSQMNGTVYDCQAAVRTQGQPGLLPWSAPLRASSVVGCGLDVAIFRGTRLFGAIGVYDIGERTFTPVETDFLKSIATLVATALERHEAKSRLTFLDQYDQLTSLPNRRRLTRFLDDSIARAKSRADSCAVLLIDLDRFKDVNDTLGHTAGDELLVQAARRLLDCVRAGDVVGRLGGDEFAVVLPAAAQRRESRAVAAAIVESLGRPYRVQGQQVYATASVGIATWPGDGEAAEALIRNADNAMYSAKKAGRNTHSFYMPVMNEDATRRLRTEAELREALRREEFVLHYQPKVSLATGKLAGFEALLRWQHPVRGLVPPLEFIGILEDTGIIIPVGEWIIGQVCRQLLLWEREGAAPVPVAINLSARQFQQADLAQVIERIVGASGANPQLLEFELTESLLMADPESAAATLAAIKRLGMHLSIDDFGTGYSSLAYLKRFPLDTLKIDRAFVRDLPEDGDDAAITQAVISLAHHLSLKVVAEGVETLEQARTLHGYACDQIQGYYASRPLPAAECTALLARGQLIDRALLAAPPMRLVASDEAGHGAADGSAAAA
ncbi:EAL domain-containing protein [Massilia solisilvae]|uniref:EAL domain-containing protein n=1 Tax=Massilia solisilvae TaxID=1811225 RepID=A0ABT2BH77_9BURK|nr:EAL domain-containing protein [Massilia solisilvae]MCS0607866.1 EAL domain-containing protein [Massilia solisilvae]